MIKNIKELNESAEAYHEEVEEKSSELLKIEKDLQNRQVQVDELLSDTNAKRDEIVELFDADEERSKEIETLLVDAKSNKEIIDGFSKRVSTREAQLEDQETKTDNYLAKLEEYQNRQEALISKANNLISSARTALQYKTAEGISAAFIEKLDEAKADKTTRNWVIASGFFLLLAVGIGFWIVIEDNATLEVMIGRISLIPILIAGAWFCAAQYVKQKNLIEDYAYKSVLAKSLVGFADQLSTEEGNGDEYSHFIRSVLDEIHNDPLRKRSGKIVTQNEAKAELTDLIKEMKIFQDIGAKTGCLFKAKVLEMPKCVIRLGRQLK